MNKKNFYLSIVFISLVFVLTGQDLNQTNTRYSPLYQNPAFTGGFYGTIRLGGTYRDQGRQLMGEGFKTMNIFIDAPISISLGKNNWIGAGLQIYNDKAGAAQMVTQGVILNMAYHLSFDKKYKNVLSFGAQYGMIQKKLDGEKIEVASDYVDPGVTLTDRAALSAYKADYKDTNFGVAFKSKFAKASSFTIGIAAYHIFAPKYAGIKYNNYVNRRYTFHSGLYYRLTKIFMIEPQIIVSLSNNSSNIMPQFKSFIKLSKDKNKTDMVYFGLGYRINDALQVMMGMKYKNFDIGFAYDITISSAAQYNNHQGGIEFGVYKIFQIHKKRDVTPILICPEL